MVISMEENRFPITDADGGKDQSSEGSGCIVAAEPAVAYAVKEACPTSGIVYMDEEADKIDHLPLGMFGFFTDDPEVLEQRIAEIEADLDEVDAGIEDPEKWITSEQMWTELYQKYPWLR